MHTRLMGVNWNDPVILEVLLDAGAGQIWGEEAEAVRIFWKRILSVALISRDTVITRILSIIIAIFQAENKSTTYYHRAAAENISDANSYFLFPGQWQRICCPYDEHLPVTYLQTATVYLPS